jgi:hypothetical protein
MRNKLTWLARAAWLGLALGSATLMVSSFVLARAAPLPLMARAESFASLGMASLGTLLALLWVSERPRGARE